MYRWALWAGDTAPPGSDGGAWLAFNYELFGTRVKADPGTYPPVVPLVVRGLLLFFTPLAALKVLGLLASVLAGIPLYLLARLSVNSWLAVALAVAFVLADYQVEILAFGGYPQLLGTAGLLFSLYYLSRGLSTGSQRYLFLSAGLGALALGCSTRIAYQLPMVIAVYLGVYLYNQGSLTRPFLKGVGIWALALGGISVVLLPFYWEYIRLLDSNVTNPHDFSLFSFFLDIADWRPETRVWLVIAILALPVSFLAVLFRWRAPGALVAAPLVLGPLISLLTVREIRDFQMLQAGLVLSLAVAVGLLWDHRAVLSRTNGRTALVVSVLLLTALVVGLGHRRAEVAFDWYRVVDSATLEALDWLREEGEAGSLVAASEAPRGGIYGWWVEGYGRHPAYNAADPKWFIFRQEKDSTRVASRLLSEELTPGEMGAIAETHGIRYLFLNARASARDYSLLYEAGFTVVFANQAIVVLAYGEAESTG